MTLLPATTTSWMMFPLLGGAMLILYIAGRFTIGALPRALDRSGPRAVLALAPVLAVSLLAVCMGRPQIALHLPIACAVAALTFGLSAVLAGRTAPEGMAANRSWTLIVPAVAILLVAGLGPRLDLAVLVAMLAYGLLAIYGWSDDPAEAITPEEEAAERPGVSLPLAAALWALGLLAAGVAGAMAMKGTQHLEAYRGRPSESLVAVFLIAPAIVVPFFFELLPPCRSIGWRGSISSLLKFATLCVCCVLPVAAVLVALHERFGPLVRSWAPGPTTQPTSLPTTLALSTEPLIFPSMPTIALRADVLVLIGVSLLMIPAGGGWLKPGKVEALVLLACYVVYLGLVMASSI